MLSQPCWHAAGWITSLRAAACLWGNCGVRMDQLCETSLQGSCVAPLGAGGQMCLLSPSLRAQCRVMDCREWSPPFRILLILQTCSPSPLQPPGHLLGVGTGTCLWQEKG